MEEVADGVLTVKELDIVIDIVRGSCGVTVVAVGLKEKVREEDLEVVGDMDNVRVGVWFEADMAYVLTVGLNDAEGEDDTVLVAFTFDTVGDSDEEGVAVVTSRDGVIVLFE